MPSSPDDREGYNPRTPSTQERVLAEQLNILGKRNDELRKELSSVQVALQVYEGHIKALVDLLQHAEVQAKQLAQSVNILRRDVERGAASPALLPFWESETKKAEAHHARLQDALVSLRSVHAEIHFKASSLPLL